MSELTREPCWDATSATESAEQPRTVSEPQFGYRTAQKGAQP
jgi:hypothetical protein